MALTLPTLDDFYYVYSDRPDLAESKQSQTSLF